MTLLKRLLARVSTVPTRGAGCALILFMSGTLLALTVALALNEVNPA